MKKRLTAILLSVALMLGLTSFAAAEGDIPQTAATFDELTALIDSGVTAIEITDTINIAGSIGNADKTITLTRSTDFTEEPMLQVENGNIQNIIIDGANVVTTYRAAVIDGSCHFEDVTFQNCSAGAVFVTSGTAIFDNCTFAYNVGETGAHVINNAESVFTGCSFQFGEAGNSGGAINNTNILQLQNCSFSGNHTAIEEDFCCGGAVYNSGSLYAYKCSFSDNASMQGGALYNSDNSELIECTFANNTANVGGAISNAGTATIIDTLICKNSATEEGADLDSSSPISVSYNEGYAFSEVPSGWHNDSYNNRSGDKLFEPIL